MKYIFLDFDGVLNSDYWFSSSQYRKETKGMMPAEVMLTQIKYHLSPQLLSKVDELVDKTGAQVIVSSTWRLHYSDEELNEMLEIRGAKFRISGRTPRGYPRRFSQPVVRGDEIMEFIKNLPDMPEGIVILDDIYNMVQLTPYLVLTNDRYGITADDVKKAIDIINQPFEMPKTDTEEPEEDFMWDGK